jgi:DNA-binding winged helix-turn-helix (wHTH) protein/tetratricopeptide (TPR) repeat protein
MVRSPGGLREAMPIAFEEFELNERLYQLRRSGTLVPLPPKAFDLLAYLLRHRDRVVPKAELLARVWPAEVVTSSSLTSCVNTLRDCLGGDVGSRRLIETVRGRGYRFSGRVEPSRLAMNEPTPEQVANAPRRPIFVGREDELRRMTAILEQVLEGHGQAILITGDAGIGKTRLVEEFCARARAAGASVAVGAAREEEGVPAFWPWVESLRGVMDDLDDLKLRRMLGLGAAELAELVPTIAARLPDVPPAQAPGAEHARVRLFDSVSRFLAAAAARRPLVLALEDLHLADRSSLLLLQFLARHVGAAPLVVVATYRDSEVAPDDLVVSVASTLRRDATCTRLSLRGLGPTDVRDLMQARVRDRVPDALVEAVVRTTEGNPLYVIEMHDHLLEEAADRGLDGSGSARTVDLATVGVPEGIRHIISRRLARLSAGSIETIRLGAVLGHEFSFDVLARVSRSSRERLVEQLDEAVAAGVLIARPPPARRYAFSHALIRETLYQALPSLTRVRLHRRVGRTLAHFYGDDDAHAAEVAHHLLEATPLGGVASAVAYATRAGRCSAAALAYEDAETHYGRALAAVATVRNPPQAERGRLLVALAEAQSRSGRTGAGHEAFREAAAVARASGDVELLVQATLGLGGRHLRLFGSVDREAIATLEDTVAVVSEGPPALRAALLARLAMALRHDPASLERRCALAAEAVCLARQVNAPALVASVLDDVLWGLWRPANLDERRAISAELVALSRAAGDSELELRAHGWCIVTLLEAGDLAGVDAAIREHALLGERLRLHPYRWDVLHYRAMRALMAGRFADAERLADEGYAGREYRPPYNADLVYGTQIGLIRVMQGRPADVIPMVERLLDRHPSSWRAALAWIYVHTGDLVAARRELDGLAARQFTDLPEDSVWLTSVAFLSVVCHALRDDRCAALLAARLRPYLDRMVVVSEYGLACLGSVRHYAALLADARGRADEACQLFERALAVHVEHGALPQVAMTCAAYAQCLLERGDRADRPHARRLLAESAALADRLGMAQLVSQARASAAAASPRSAMP